MKTTVKTTIWITTALLLLLTGTSAFAEYRCTARLYDMTKVFLGKKKPVLIFEQVLREDTGMRSGSLLELINTGDAQENGNISIMLVGIISAWPNSPQRNYLEVKLIKNVWIYAKSTTSTDLSDVIRLTGKAGASIQFSDYQLDLDCDVVD